VAEPNLEIVEVVLEAARDDLGRLDDDPDPAAERPGGHRSGHR
jgi:hypothetical protein